MSKKAQLGNLLGQRSAQPVVNHSAHEEILSQPVNTALQETLNTSTQEPVNTGLPKKKKATFDMDLELHTKLKIYAASQGKTMVEIIEELLRSHIL